MLNLVMSRQSKHFKFCFNISLILFSNPSISLFNVDDTRARLSTAKKKYNKRKMHKTYPVSSSLFITHMIRNGKVFQTMKYVCNIFTLNACNHFYFHTSIKIWLEESTKTGPSLLIIICWFLLLSFSIRNVQYTKIHTIYEKKNSFLNCHFLYFQFYFSFCPLIIASHIHKNNVLCKTYTYKYRKWKLKKRKKKSVNFEFIAILSFSNFSPLLCSCFFLLLFPFTFLHFT